MRLDRMRVGDLVLCSIKGRRIYGQVLEITTGTVQFQPLCPGAGWRHAQARDIIAHWRKTSRKADSAPTADDDEPADRPPREQLSLPIHT